MPMPAWPSGSARKAPPARENRITEKSLVPPPKSATSTVASRSSRRAKENAAPDGLVDIAGVAGAKALERGPVALHRQRLVGIAAGEAHGAADRDGGRLEAEFIAAMARQRPQERRQNILELVALPEHLGGVEAGARGEGLERLEEAVDMAAFQELLDRPRAAFGLGAGSRPVLPEAQRRHEDAVALSAMVEADGLDPAVVRCKGHDRVAGPKIDADRDGGRGARHEPL